MGCDGWCWRVLGVVHGWGRRVEECVDRAWLVRGRRRRDLRRVCAGLSGVVAEQRRDVHPTGRHGCKHSETSQRIQILYRLIVLAPIQVDCTNQLQKQMYNETLRPGPAATAKSRPPRHARPRRTQVPSRVPLQPDQTVSMSSIHSSPADWQAGESSSRCFYAGCRRMSVRRRSSSLPWTASSPVQMRCERKRSEVGFPFIAITVQVACWDPEHQPIIPTSPPATTSTTTTIAEQKAPPNHVGGYKKSVCCLGRWARSLSLPIHPAHITRGFILSPLQPTRRTPCYTR